MTLGLCEDYPEESRSLATARRDLELLRDAGISVLRVSIGWDEVEPERGRYDFSFWDDFVKLAVNDFHIRLIPYVAYTPRWAARKEHKNTDDYWRHPPARTQDWANALAALAQRYKGLINSWELWNEPDNHDYWRGETDEFADMLKAGAAAVRGVDAHITVVAGGLAWNVEFLEELFRDHGIGKVVDVVNLHAYHETWHHAGLEHLTEYVARVRDVVARYGQGQALWLAEVGYSNHREGARVSAAYQARFDYEHTLDFAAVSLVRTIAQARATSAVDVLAWYEVKDPPATDAVIGDVNNRHLGVAFADHKPKPAYAALKFMQQFLGVPLRVRDRDVFVTRATGSDSVVHAFETEDGKLRLLAWLATASPRVAGLSQALDPRRETVTVTIPAAAARTAVLFDHLGRRLGHRRFQPWGSAGALQLELAPGQVVVAEVAPPRRPS